MSDAQPNAAQRAYWATADHWVDDQAGHDEMLEPLGRLGMDALGPTLGERILDVGCGTGATTLALAEAVGPSGAVVGADVSALMLGVARERAAGALNVSFVEADAQVHAFEPGAFDAVFSRFGVMFFDDPVAAFANIAGAVRGGGRLAFVCWQAALQSACFRVPIEAARPHVEVDDVWSSGPNPFAFADDGYVRDMLAGAGWSDVSVEGVVRPVLLGGHGDVDTGLGFFAESRFGRAVREATDDAGAEAAFGAVREALGPYVTTRGVEIDAAVWVVSARKPS